MTAEEAGAEAVQMQAVDRQTGTTMKPGPSSLGSCRANTGFPKAERVTANGTAIPPTGSCSRAACEATPKDRLAGPIARKGALDGRGRYDGMD